MSAVPVLRRAFTLVELLVVIGVVSVLIALLMPLLGRARESARRVQCASKLRDLGFAMAQYTLENGGYFPGTAQGWSVFGDEVFGHDWIHWQNGRSFQNSTLGKYYPQPLDPNHFRCPSDDVNNRPRPPPWVFGPQFPHPYRFSYCLNHFIDSTFAAQESQNYRRFPTVTKVRNPSTIIMFGEVNERDLVNGRWMPAEAYHSGLRWFQLLSVRHDRRERDEVFSQGYDPEKSHPSARGNVVFVDGHVEYVTRRQAHNPINWASRWYLDQLRSLGF